ncbi:HAD family hydrolase [Micrococcus terreus]|uniref:HAD family hydrolase n=1 Tax=Micrococcus terreus TaxID=574650 RepID=UPI00254B6722|nr:HAD family hydrolase [Micrococcus terreus]MDK7700965.1 HAD family hydrolase [Micrococcus terreus]WOO97996.1 HAD family hydrolase [Micrococcus terreus]
MAERPQVRGVLFDLDDTLVDLRAAQLVTFEETVARQADLTGGTLPARDRVDAAALHFAADANGHYQRYVDGELDFLGQRFARARDALRMLGLAAEPDPDLWGPDGYERMLRSRWALFDDVPPLLSRLDDARIPWGVVTNNTEEYQRGKLAAVGLDQVQVVVGTDTAGAPKPDAAPFLAGCAGLGLDPADVLYVGDNPLKDGLGARDAGLVSLLILRPSAVPGDLGGGDGGTSTSQVPAGVWAGDSLESVARFVTGAKPLL